jgi:O-antigen ligase
LLPIPLGANRPWAWSFFEMAIFALTACIVIKNWKVEKLGITPYISAVYLWLAFIFVCSLQIIPLPNFVVALLSPTSFDLFYSVSADYYYISVDPGQSMVSFIKLLSFFCLFISVLALVNTERRIRLLLLTIMAAGTFQALYGAFEILLGAKTSLIFGLPIEEVATGSFVYKNHYANFLMLTLCAAVGLLVASLEKNSTSTPKDFMRSFASTLLSSKAIVRICIIIMVIGLVMSRSRMGNTAFFAAMIIVGAIAFMLIKNRSKGLTILVISMFIIDLFIVSAYFGLERVKERLAQTSLTQETRDEVVTDAYPIISDFPLFGSGGGSFYSTFPSYQTSEVAAFYDHLHNDYLQFLIEYGVIGSFILFSIFVFSVYKCLRAMHKRRNSIFKGSAYACLMVFVGMGLHMTVDFPLQAYANASYFVVFLALSMIINSLKIRRPRKSFRTT